jgi:hypothetical protein
MPRQIEPLGPLPADPTDLRHRYLTKPHCAQVAQQYFGPLRVRSLEDWPLVWYRWNSYMITPTAEFLLECERRFACAEVRDRRAPSPSVQAEDRAAA